MVKKTLLLSLLIINSLLCYANENKLLHLEDDFNEVLYIEKNSHIWKASELIQQITGKYSSNDLAKTTIDGYPGNFIINTWKAKLELLMQNYNNAMTICSNALKFEIYQGINTAPERISELFLMMNIAENKTENKIDIERTEFWDSSIEFDGQNTILQQNNLLYECYDELKENKVDDAVKTIQYALKIPAPFFFDGYDVYLAMLIQQQKYEDFVNVMLECLKKVPGKQVVVTVNTMFQFLQNINLTKEQLEELCFELEKISARFPATEKYIDEITSANKFLNSDYIKSEILFHKTFDMPLEEADTILKKYINENIYNREKAFLILGERLIEVGNTNKAIDVWLDGLEKENIVNLNKLGGEPLIAVIDNNLSVLNKEQKSKYLKIFQKQIKKLQSIIKNIKNSDSEIQYNNYSTLPDKLDKLKEKYKTLKQKL